MSATCHTQMLRLDTLSSLSEVFMTFKTNEDVEDILDRKRQEKVKKGDFEPTIAQKKKKNFLLNTGPHVGGGRFPDECDL